MKSLEYVENQIAKLKDDLQHYTMVEKDSALASQIRYDLEQFETIENKLKALNEIVALYDKWLGNGMSDYEFFTLLNDIKYKYGLENEVLLWD